MPVELRDLVIVVPGIMGSELSLQGRSVWAGSLRGLSRVAYTLGGSLSRLAVEADSAEIDDLGDGVEATGLIHIPAILPRLIKADGYTGLLTRLGDYFDVTTDGVYTNVCGFPYDWRRDCRVAARRLKRFVDERLAWWRQRSGPDAKVIFVAHSMGGLVSRFFLDVHGGWRDCRALFTLGTPFRGSPQALEYLVNGYIVGGLIDVSKVVRTFTSVYQLLPTYPMIATEGGVKRVVETLDIPNLDYQKVMAARAFYEELNTAVAKNSRDPEYIQCGYKLIPVVGRDQPTCQSAQFVNAHLQTSVDPPANLPEQLFGGDGTVPRLSASPIDLDGQARETFVVERHASLHVNEFVLIDLIGKIEQLQAPGTGAFLGGRIEGDRPALSVALEDWYPVGATVSLAVASLHGKPAAPPVARVTAIGDTRSLNVPATPSGDNEWVFTLGQLVEGEYRVEVSDPGGAAPPVHDLFEVSTQVIWR